MKAHQSLLIAGLVLAVAGCKQEYPPAQPITDAAPPATPAQEPMQQPAAAVRPTESGMSGTTGALLGGLAGYMLGRSTAPSQPVVAAPAAPAPVIVHRTVVIKEVRKDKEKPAPEMAKPAAPVAAATPANPPAPAPAPTPMPAAVKPPQKTSFASGGYASVRQSAPTYSIRRR